MTERFGSENRFRLGILASVILFSTGVLAESRVGKCVGTVDWVTGSDNGITVCKDELGGLVAQGYDTAYRQLGGNIDHFWSLPSKYRILMLKEYLNNDRTVYAIVSLNLNSGETTTLLIKHSTD